MNLKRAFPAWLEEWGRTGYAIDGERHEEVLTIQLQVTKEALKKNLKDFLDDFTEHS